MDGSNKVAIPACEVKANSFIEAHNKLNKFLITKEPDEDIRLITPIERIDFEAHT